MSYAIPMVSTKKIAIEYTHRKTRRESKCITTKTPLNTRKAVMENLRDKQTIRNTENKS